MVHVEFMGPIGKEPLELQVDSLEDLKKELLKDEDLQQWLSMSAVAVNDTMVASLHHSLKDGDKVTILPPVCGG